MPEKKNLLVVLKYILKWTLNMYFPYIIGIKSNNMPILIIGLNNIVYFKATFHLCKQITWSV
jgi:hypothetical protein